MACFKLFLLKLFFHEVEVKNKSLISPFNELQQLEFTAHYLAFISCPVFFSCFVSTVAFKLENILKVVLYSPHTGGVGCAY